MTGFLFKVIREQIPRTQEELAADLGVDKSTLQGWESGRRPLSATKVGNLVAVRRKLIRLGAPPPLVEALNLAMDADFILGEILISAGDQPTGEHPLASWVLTRDTTHMIGWAVSGVLPGVVAAQMNLPAARRGPVASAPILGAADRSTFFNTLRQNAERAGREGEDVALLRRQVFYLSSYERGWDAADWFDGMRRSGRLTASVSGWSPRWAEARSVAAALARQGDPELLRDFIARSLTENDAAENANLNYWAHWLGLDSRPQIDDSFMAERGRPVWDASALLRQLAVRLDRAAEYTDLYVHSIWALLIARRGLLDADPHVAEDLGARVRILLDGDRLSSQSRRELEAVYYGLRIGGFGTTRN
ncbi:helix-turn-helix domain-containing protein [Kitasatospora sp. RB6PN24]|uniref:helix-turn-helix domain-containing protein n=1 Tax=Kitasatospora humi TaxID=2893891 RepID=UPI001E5BCDA3|nr:helix-turn-helix transcriptional regulator [Kitasatospora humi]MCC9311936.1 helix-turn-helix domain-containing protein [Kitasatospora humi]